MSSIARVVPSPNSPPKLAASILNLWSLDRQRPPWDCHASLALASDDEFVESSWYREDEWYVSVEERKREQEDREEATIIYYCAMTHFNGF